MSSSTKFEIMRKFDLYILDRLDSLKEKPEFRKIIDQQNSLDDKYKLAIRYALLVLSLGIPLIILSIFFALYSSYSSELEMHELIIQKATRVRDLSVEASDQRASHIGAVISSESLLKTKISSLLSTSGIDQSKITISNFNLNENAGISEIEATMQFKEISDSQLYNIFNKVLILGKFKASAIDILKNEKTQLLEGTIDLAYFGRLDKNEE